MWWMSHLAKIISPLLLKYTWTHTKTHSPSASQSPVGPPLPSGWIITSLSNLRSLVWPAAASPVSFFTFTPLTPVSASLNLLFHLLGIISPTLLLLPPLLPFLPTLSSPCASCGLSVKFTSPMEPSLPPGVFFFCDTFSCSLQQLGPIQVKFLLKTSDSS